MNVALVVISDRGHEYLPACFESLITHLRHYPFTHYVLVDDSADPAIAEWLLTEGMPSKFSLLHHTTKRGLAGAVQSAWTWLTSNNVDYAFHMEEDFLLRATPPINNMISVLEKFNLANVVLRRQPWGSDSEEGGYINADPAAFAEILTPDGVINLHRKGFWLNPCVYGRRIFEQGWPDSNEAGMTERLNANPGTRYGVWGSRNDPPMVEHVGHIRSQGWKE